MREYVYALPSVLVKSDGCVGLTAYPKAYYSPVNAIGLNTRPQQYIKNSWVSPDEDGEGVVDGVPGALVVESRRGGGRRRRAHAQERVEGFGLESAGACVASAIVSPRVWKYSTMFINTQAVLRGFIGVS